MLQFRRGDLLRMRFFWFSNGCDLEVRPGVVHVIGVELAGVSARCVIGSVAPTSMIRRLRPGHGTTTRTAQDDQSETDSQSHSSEEINTAAQVLSSKGKAQVCTDKDYQRSRRELLR
jgi:hypothetical protein